MTAAVDDLVPRAEVLRPGLLVLPVRGAARYFGSEQAAAERLVDAVAAAGAECQVGIADRLPTAVFAARAGRIIEPGNDAVFLSALSIRQLATEPSLAAPGRDDLADLLWRMGIRNIGQFAALSRADVASRFGADAVAAHRFARAEPSRGPSGREPPPDLDAVMDCDPPIDRVDAAAFAGRSLASDLHRSLESAGVGCTRLAIHAVTANGEELNRVWRCAEPLTEDATADRVRWQLDGWLNRRNPKTGRPRRSPCCGCSRWKWCRPGRCNCRCGVASGGGPAACPSCADPGSGSARTGGRAGAGAQRRPWTGRAHHVDAVGRRAGAAGRPEAAVAGTTARALADRAARRPGRSARRRRQSGAGDQQGTVLRGAGAAAAPGREGTLSWWAGPWPVDERWWDPDRKAGRTARAQVLLDGDPGGAAAVLPPAAVVPGRDLRIVSQLFDVRQLPCLFEQCLVRTVEPEDHLESVAGLGRYPVR